MRELQDRSLAEGGRRDGNHISRVLNGDDNSGSQNDLFPGLTKVDDVDTIIFPLPDVILHLEIRVLGTNVNIGGQKLLNIVLPAKKSA